MINIVFLLLIFFMVSSELASSPPIDVTPPEATAGESPPTDDTLYVDASGLVAWRGILGEPAFDALSGRELRDPLIIRADAAFPANDLAGLIARMSEMGIVNVSLSIQRSGNDR